MDDITPLVAALIGGTAGFLSGPFQLLLHRREDRRSVASAFAGEVNAILEMAERVGPSSIISDYLQKLRAGTDQSFPLVIRDVKFEEVYLANVARLGTLKGDLPERIASFYTLLFNIRGDLKAVETGACDSKGLGAKAVIVEQALKQWSALEVMGRCLVLDLRAAAQESSYLAKVAVVTVCVLLTAVTLGLGRAP